MKEAYPTPGKKPPAPSVRPFAQSKANKPDDCFTGTRADWEEAIFRHAEYFTVVRKLPRTVKYESVKYDRRVLQTFPEAVANAKGDPTAMVYAVSDGHSFCIPPKEWEKYGLIWEEKR